MWWSGQACTSRKGYFSHHLQHVYLLWTGWLVDRSAVSWLASWLVSLVGYSVSLSVRRSVCCWLVNRLGGQNIFYRLVGWSIAQLVDLTGWLTSWLVGWLIAWLVGRLPSWLVGRLSSWLSNWICRLLLWMGEGAPPNTPSSDGPDHLHFPSCCIIVFTHLLLFRIFLPKKRRLYL